MLGATKVSDDDRKYLDSLINRSLGLQLMGMQSDEYLRFLFEIRENPTPENIARLSRWNQQAEAYLANRVEQSRQPQLTPAVEMFSNAQQQKFLN